MNFEEFDFKSAAKSDKTMNTISYIVAGTLWVLMFIAIAWRL